MSHNYILVVDFGTSNVHVNAFDTQDGKIVCSTNAKYPLLATEPGYSEIDPEVVFEKSEECVARVLEELKQKNEPYIIDALSFSFFGDNMIAVDEKGTPLMNLIQAFDTRAKQEIDDLCEEVKKRGIMENPEEEFFIFSTAGKILWARRRMDGVKKYYSIQQFILNRLGVQDVNDATMATTKRLMDMENLQWKKEILDIMDITPEALGDIVSADTIVGEIEAYGTAKFPNKVKVVPGAHDAACAWLGLGVPEEPTGVLGDITGTFEHVGFLFKNLDAFREKNSSSVAYVSPGASKGSWVTMDAIETSGALLEWFMREIHGDTGAESYEEMWKDCQFDDVNRTKVEGNFNLEQGTFVNLGLHTTKKDLFKAIIERITLECRRMIRGVAASSPVAVTTVRIGGGTARSPIWNQLRADITGLVFECLDNIEVSSTGAAILAAVACGIYSSTEDAMQHMIHVKEVFRPKESIVALYDEKYKQ